jgi:hypothetical protein
MCQEVVAQIRELVGNIGKDWDGVFWSILHSFAY